MSEDQGAQGGAYPFAAMPPKPTGGLIVTFREQTTASDVERALQSIDPSLKVMNLMDFTPGLDGVRDQGDSADAVVFPRFRTAVLNPGDPDRVASLRDSLRTRGAVQEVRPEFWMFAIENPAPAFADDGASTWGLKAVVADRSRYTGRGVRIAVLDTGLDLNHPDFRGRTIQSQSFVPNQEVQDGQGHGTHCIGTAAGGAADNGVRYGVAPDAEIMVGKVLSNEGSGRESWILEGMEWAIQEQCPVISMSLGRAVAPGEPHSPEYENAGRAALDAGCLIIAAAGNESARKYNHVAPVGAPANSPSILAVAAVDSALGVADFSCGGVNAGGAVDIAAPGVDVFSSVPMPRRYRRLQGTSMAAPHVAGVAALIAEAQPDLRGARLWEELIRTATRLGSPARDVGAGLVQAP